MNKGYIHVVEIESSILCGKFHFHTVLGCVETDFKYVTVYSQALEGKPSMPKVCLFGRNSLPT